MKLTYKIDPGTMSRVEYLADLGEVAIAGPFAATAVEELMTRYLTQTLERDLTIPERNLITRASNCIRGEIYDGKTLVIGKKRLPGISNWGRACTSILFGALEYHYGREAANRPLLK